MKQERLKEGDINLASFIKQSGTKSAKSKLTIQNISIQFKKLNLKIKVMNPILSLTGSIFLNISHNSRRNRIQGDKDQQRLVMMFLSS